MPRIGKALQVHWLLRETPVPVLAGKPRSEGAGSERLSLREPRTLPLLPGTSRRVPGLGSVDSPSRSDTTFRLSETAAAPVPGGCLVCHAKPRSEHSPEAKTLL